MSEISEYLQEFGSLYYRVLQPDLTINQLFSIYIIYRLVKIKEKKIKWPVPVPVLFRRIQIYTVHIYTRLETNSNTNDFFIFFFCVVKSDNGLELLTVHILNIFIYFSSSITCPGRKSFTSLITNFLMYFPHFIFLQCLYNVMKNKNI